MTAQLAVLEGDRVVGLDSAALKTSGGWVRPNAAGNVSGQRERLRLRLETTGGETTSVQFDDMAVSVQGHVAPGTTPFTRRRSSIPPARCRP